jgi:outer membrane receptor protein involved in Fe transport
MFAISYGVSVATFLASNEASDLFSLSGAPDKRNVENAPTQMASLKAAIPIMNRALSAGSRLSIEGPRYDRYENSTDPAQGKTRGSAIWDLVLTGEEAHYGLHYALGVYNLLDWRYSVPVSNEFAQRSIPQSGRSFLASVDVKY